MKGHADLIGILWVVFLFLAIVYLLKSPDGYDRPSAPPTSPAGP